MALLWESYLVAVIYHPRKESEILLLGEQQQRSLLYHDSFIKVAAWIGFFTEVFYFGHGVALCIVLANIPNGVPDDCINILVKVSSIILFHHIVSLIICIVHWKNSTNSPNSTNHFQTPYMWGCFTVLKILVFSCCVTAIPATTACMLTSQLGLCVLAYMGGILFSIVLFLVLYSIFRCFVG